MTEVMSRGNTIDSRPHERIDPPGEIIEERRKDSEGRIGTYKYLKGKMLGKGGFAKCYVGTSMRSRNQYALKIVSKSTLVKPRAEQKLRSEIRIHRTLNHENIVRFERYFEDSANAYLLLELCMNNSMSDLMKRRKKLVEFEARYYVSQIIHSLKYLHKHNVIHRDLKLGNLFINHDMRIKVGDFGLATKLSRPDERKKTICGTPNYIAPEILEGKNGHSFEVDIWSTGVILYTLLVGKPPFEAKDVKSTYKRIVANQYSFPDHTVVSPEAKDIIRFTLQPRPEKRPNLEQMLNHPFFTGPEAYCPSSLPESCLRESPLAAAPAKKVDETMPGATINDENDPGAINRVDQPLLNVKIGGNGSHSRPVLAERPSSASSASATAAVGARAYGASTSISRRPSSASMKLGADRGITTSLGVSGDKAPPALSSVGRASSTGSAYPMSTAGPYQQAFDVYQDTDRTNQAGMRSSRAGNKSNGSGASFATLRQSGMTTTEDVSTAKYNSYTTRGNVSGSTHATSSRSAKLDESEATDTDAMDVDVEVDRINNGFKQVQISKQTKAVSAWSESAPRAPAATTSATVATPVGDKLASGSQGANAHQLDTLETMHKMLNRSLTSSEREAATANGYMLTHATNSGKVGKDSPTNKPPGSSSGDQEDSLDSPQVYAQEDEEDKQNQHGGGYPQENAPKVAYEMTSMAKASVNADAEFIANMENIRNGSKYHANQVGTGSELVSDMSKSTAKVWVVRYVDYTSKYGLGFLLNTGSAGVYFNDSTKIVLSADGTIFQYIERRKRDSASTSSSSSEHLTQTHFMSAYPQELQKKVTLLRHFRNYLVDQQRTYGENAKEGDGSDAAAPSSSAALNLPTLLPETSTSGATSTIKFGVSSACFDSKGAIEIGLGEGYREGASGMESHDGEMPFLKKWVRTRHAILFRLSNRVVQVVFFDRSEVLLSPEARMVTYVNKTGIREEHSLEDVLHSGRSDISKRLKYTKDIIWRLINVSSSGSSSSNTHHGTR